MAERSVFVTLVGQGTRGGHVKIRARRDVLTQESKWFKEKLKDTPDDTEIPVPLTDSKNLNVIYRFMCEDKVDLNETNVDVLWVDAFRLTMEKLKAICRPYMVERIGENNWWMKLLIYTDLDGFEDIEDLKVAVKEYIAKNYVSCLECAKFYKLQKQEVIEILQIAEGRKHCSLEFLFHRVLGWMKEDESNRSKDAFFLWKLLAEGPSRPSQSGQAGGSFCEKSTRSGTGAKRSGSAAVKSNAVDLHLQPSGAKKRRQDETLTQAPQPRAMPTTNSPTTAKARGNKN